MIARLSRPLSRRPARRTRALSTPRIDFGTPGIQSKRFRCQLESLCSQTANEAGVRLVAGQQLLQPLSRLLDLQVSLERWRPDPLLSILLLELQKLLLKQGLRLPPRGVPSPL